jgi:hypothetical protein
MIETTPENARTTDDGDFRITDDEDFRIFD